MAQNNAQTLALALIALIQKNPSYDACITYTTTEQMISGVYIFKADWHRNLVIIDTENDCVVTTDCDDHSLTTTNTSSEYTASGLLESLLSF